MCEYYIIYLLIYLTILRLSAHNEIKLPLQ